MLTDLSHLSRLKCTVFLFVFIPLCCFSLNSCSPEAPPTDKWTPLVLLRDNTDTWPNHKPEGGWWVTPIHTTLLPDGKVLITGWGRKDKDKCQPGGTRKHGVSFILDPNNLPKTSLEILPIDEQGDPTTDVLYCSGHGFFPDGRILFAGGAQYEHLGMPNEIEMGINYARLYDPSNNTFSRIDSRMDGGPVEGKGMRWYPTITRLPNSHTLVTGGFYRCCGKEYANLSIEVFDHQKYDTHRAPWSLLVPHTQSLPEITPGFRDYTHVHVLPQPIPAKKSGDISRQVVMMGGAGEMLLFNYADKLSPSRRFVKPPHGNRDGGAEAATGALLPTGEVLVLGGTTDPTVAQRGDIYNPHKDSWKSIDTGIGRYHPSSVLLPDGTVFVVNGSTRPDYPGDSRRPQIIDPVTGRVTTKPPWPNDPEGRGYHNIALMLKDARVLVGGGLDSSDPKIGCERPDIRIYSPPYLDKGPRPAFTEVEEPVNMMVDGNNMEFNFAHGPLKKRNGVVLMAPGSPTHSFDQNQRFVALDFTVPQAGRVEVSPPGNYSQAPAGDYFLFLVNQRGVPSVGKHVRLR